MAEDPRLDRLKELTKNKYRNVQEEEERAALAQEYPQFDGGKDEESEPTHTDTTSTGVGKKKSA